MFGFPKIFCFQKMLRTYSPTQVKLQKTLILIHNCPKHFMKQIRYKFHKIITSDFFPFQKLFELRQVYFAFSCFSFINLVPFGWRLVWIMCWNFISGSPIHQSYVSGWSIYILIIQEGRSLNIWKGKMCLKLFCFHFYH